MRYYIERKSDKKGWVAYPFSAGRPLDLKKVGASSRLVVEAPTKAEAQAKFLAAVGFTPANV